MKQSTELIDIGDVVAATGVPTTTLHVWENRGLIEPIARRGLRRQYDPDVVQRIGVIVLCQQAGFSLGEIGEMLDPDAFANDKALLVGKRRQLEERRRLIDRAIDGIDHALSCENDSPITCPGFLAHVDEVLPVDAQRSTGPL